MTLKLIYPALAQIFWSFVVLVIMFRRRKQAFANREVGLADAVGEERVVDLGLEHRVVDERLVVAAHLDVRELLAAQRLHRVADARVQRPLSGRTAADLGVGEQLPAEVRRVALAVDDREVDLAALERAQAGERLRLWLKRLGVEPRSGARQSRCPPTPGRLGHHQ